MTAPTITIDLPGEPRGKGRVRFRIITPKGKSPFASFYLDAETAGYEKALAQLARILMRSRPPLEGPLRVLATATFTPPASWSGAKKTRALAGVIRPTGKPDFDNIAKMLDALNKIVWVDDAQVVDGRALKVYGAQASLKIEVWEIAPGLLDVAEAA